MKEPTDPSAVDEVPAWASLLRWTWLRLLRELGAPSVRVAVCFLAIGSLALVLSRWPFLFRLPWFVFALIVAVMLLASRRGIASLGLLGDVIVVPFALALRNSPPLSPAPDVEEARFTVVSAPPLICES